MCYTQRTFSQHIYTYLNADRLNELKFVATFIGNFFNTGQQNKWKNKPEKERELRGRARSHSTYYTSETKLFNEKFIEKGKRKNLCWKIKFISFVVCACCVCVCVCVIFGFWPACVT